MFFTALLAFGCATGQQASRQAETSYKLGVAFLSEGRAAPALQELSKAEAFSPEDPKILNALGLAYWARREFGPAEEKLRKATTVKADYSEAWNNLGALYIELGRFDQAIPALEQALKNVFYGTQERALTNLGWALYKSGRGGEGEKRLQQAIEAAPQFPLAHKNLGILLQERGEYAGALERYDAALRYGGEDPDIYLKKGVCLWKTGDRQHARAAFEKARQLAPASEAGKSAKTYLDLLQ